MEFKPLDGVSKYELQWKEHPENWELHGQSKAVSSRETNRVTAAGLNPGATYCVRMVCVGGGEKGQPGNELIVDTEQVGCTPKADQGCSCIVQ